MVNGPPSSICFLNNGTTEPLEPNTLPNLVVTYWVVILLSVFNFSCNA